MSGSTGQDGTAITIEVNGDPRRVAPPITVTALLDDLGLKSGQIAVELNRTILPRDRYVTELRDGDRLEIVTFVGGG